MQETSRFENEVTLGGKWDGWTRTESELALPRAEEDGFMEDLEEDPAEEDRCAPGGKKTQPKKTTFSNRPNYRTFRMAMTVPRSANRHLRPQQPHRESGAVFRSHPRGRWDPSSCSARSSLAAFEWLPAGNPGFGGHRGPQSGDWAFGNRRSTRSGSRRPPVLIRPSDRGPPGARKDQRTGGPTRRVVACGGGRSVVPMP